MAAFAQKGDVIFVDKNIHSCVWDGIRLSMATVERFSHNNPEDLATAFLASSVLGLFEGHTPKFVRQYAAIGKTMQAAFEQYKSDVQSGIFPGQEHGYAMPDDAWAEINGM